MQVECVSDHVCLQMRVAVWLCVCVCVCAPVFYCPINNAPTLLACQPYSTIVYNRKMADYCLILRIMERVCVNAIASQAA